MDSLLPRCPQGVALGHHRHLPDHETDVAVGQQQQRGQHLGHMELSQRRADLVNGGGGNEQEGGHERKDALEHQRCHGNQAPGDGDCPDIQ